MLRSLGSVFGAAAAGGVWQLRSASGIDHCEAPEPACYAEFSAWAGRRQQEGDAVQQRQDLDRCLHRRREVACAMHVSLFDECIQKCAIVPGDKTDMNDEAAVAKLTSRFANCQRDDKLCGDHFARVQKCANHCEQTDRRALEEFYGLKLDETRRFLQAQFDLVDDEDDTPPPSLAELTAQHQLEEEAAKRAADARVLKPGESAEAGFIASQSWTGSKRGMVFMRGEQGQGYYKDEPTEASCGEDCDH